MKKLPPKTKPSIHSSEGGTRFMLWPAVTTYDYAADGVFWQKTRRTKEVSWIVFSHNQAPRGLAIVQFRDADQYQDGDDKWYVQLIKGTKVLRSIYGPFDTLAEALTLVWRKS